jgi:4-amino-4-deoxy-L-arabinose transferase-like glycosyltransferase
VCDPSLQPVAQTVPNTDKSPSFTRFLDDCWPLLLASLVLWAVLPGLYFGNLHTDTLEAAYWARDLAWGYSKHPPLVSWLISLILKPGSAPIFTFLVLGQGLAILSAYFVYALVDRMSGRGNAILAACMMMVTSVASFYAPQVNHNTVLIPFCAAVSFFGYRLLDRRELSDAVGLGIATGLGFITKYEIIFALVPLFVASIVVKRFRTVFLSAKMWLSILIAFGLVTPHLEWLSQHGWTSVSRAVGSAPLDGIAAAAFSLWGLLIGFLAVIASPVLLIALSRRISALQSFLTVRGNTIHQLGLCFLLTPLLAVVVASLATDQFVKALWMLPLTPSAMIGLALMVPKSSQHEAAVKQRDVRVAIGLSAALFVSFNLYLAVSEVIDKPVESYLADTRPVSDAAETLWRRHSAEPLSCIVADEGKIAISPVLWVESRPQILPLSSSDWLTKERREACTATGGIAVKFVLDGRFPIEETFPHACVNEAVHLHVGSVFGIAKTGWDAELIYIPPENHPDCAN